MHKFVLSIMLSAGFLFLPLAVSADPQHGMGTGGGMGMMGGGMEAGGHGAMMGHGMEGCGMGMMGGGMMGLEQFSALNLTPDQRTKLNKIKLDLQKQHWALKGKTFDYQASLSDLWNADRPDPKKIGTVYGQLFDIRRQMIESSIDAMNKGLDILTKEQLDRFKQLKQRHNAGACPMQEEMQGHEMMHGHEMKDH
jgi:Spy/CpxP family protein refolding chaperone